MKNILHFLVITALSVALCSCGNDDNDDENKKSLILTSDKTTIAADGVETVVFTVTYDGADVTGEASVCIKDVACLGTNSFSTEEAGVYLFYATYNEIQSDLVTVTAN